MFEENFDFKNSILLEMIGMKSQMFQFDSYLKRQTEKEK